MHTHLAFRLQNIYYTLCLFCLYKLLFWIKHLSVNLYKFEKYNVYSYHLCIQNTNKYTSPILFCYFSHSFAADRESGHHAAQNGTAVLSELFSLVFATALTDQAHALRVRHQAGVPLHELPVHEQAEVQPQGAHYAQARIHTECVNSVNMNIMDLAAKHIRVQVLGCTNLWSFRLSEGIDRKDLYVV